jgi:glutamate--cysteine ligase
MTEQAWKKAGEDGLTAMRGTTGVQYNFDTSQENWVRRYRTAFALQPFISALSANSPFLNGVDTKHASHRSVLWFKNWGGDWARDVANTVFADNFSLPKLTDYIATHLPLPFLVRPGDNGGINYIDVGGKTLKELLSVHPLELHPINENDVEAMVGFAFLPVKPKKKGVIESRGADGSYRLRHAQGAFLAGILYDPKALAIAKGLLGAINGKNYVEISEGVARSGLRAAVPWGGSVREIAAELLTVAHGGLVRRGLGEEKYLQPLMNRRRLGLMLTTTPGDALDANTRLLKRTYRLSERDALIRAFLEAAVPTPASANSPIRHDQTPSVAARPHAL